VELASVARQQAIAEIQKVIPGFDYDALLAQLKDRGVLKAKFDDTDIGYEKVQIFRIASALDPEAAGGDAAFKKFINETYHIENEYVMQLNPREFETVPEHVVQACADLLVLTRKFGLIAYGARLEPRTLGGGSTVTSSRAGPAPFRWPRTGL
jgi:hypothetical protein